MKSTGVGEEGQYWYRDEEKDARTSTLALRIPVDHLHAFMKVSVTVGSISVRRPSESRASVGPAHQVTDEQPRIGAVIK